jgi:hypothetical protein
MPPPPPALPTHGRPMERLTAWIAVKRPRPHTTPRSRRWTVEIGVTLMLLDLLYWIRR